MADQLAVRSLETDDCSWAAGLIDQRRRQYAAYSPRFWNPAEGADEIHAAFLMWLVLQPDTVAVRTDHGFLIGTVQGAPHGKRLMVDDFTVEGDERWPTDGRALLSVAADEAAQHHGTDHLRVVTARMDEPKRTMLGAIGLKVGARWWVADLEPTAEPGLNGTQRIADHDALLMDAPPVYDPGGPIVMVGEPDPSALSDLAEGAAARGAVLLVATREGGPANEPALETAGFTNPSEFYDGVPGGTVGP